MRIKLALHKARGLGLIVMTSRYRSLWLEWADGLLMTDPPQVLWQWLRIRYVVGPPPVEAMSRLADEVRELAEVASPGPWRWQLGDGAPFRDALVFSADGRRAIAGFPNRRGRQQTDANATLTAAFGSPDRALAIVEALEQVQVTLHEARMTFETQDERWDAWDLCKRSQGQVDAVLRSIAEALGIAEEQNDA